MPEETGPVKIDDQRSSMTHEKMSSISTTRRERFWLVAYGLLTAFLARLLGFASATKVGETRSLSQIDLELTVNTSDPSPLLVLTTLATNHNSGRPRRCPRHRRDCLRDSVNELTLGRDFQSAGTLSVQAYLGGMAVRGRRSTGVEWHLARGVHEEGSEVTHSFGSQVRWSYTTEGPSHGARLASH
jgi:hypothetical protein